MQEDAHELFDVTLQDGVLSTDGDGFCPEKAIKEYGNSCEVTPPS